MKGDAKVIEHLQAQLKNELTAISQYFLHHRMYKHWGLDKLAKKEYSESIGEMKHADRLMDRIFVLEGLPNLQDLAKILVGEDVPEALACDLKTEEGAQATIKAGMAYCESVVTMSHATCYKAFWTIPKSTSIFWKLRLNCWPRSACRIIFNHRWAS